MIFIMEINDIFYLMIFLIEKHINDFIADLYNWIIILIIIIIWYIVFYVSIQHFEYINYFLMEKYFLINDFMNYFSSGITVIIIIIIW